MSEYTSFLGLTMNLSKIGGLCKALARDGKSDNSFSLVQGRKGNRLLIFAVPCTGKILSLIIFYYLANSQAS